MDRGREENRLRMAITKYSGEWSRLNKANKEKEQKTTWSRVKTGNTKKHNKRSALVERKKRDPSYHISPKPLSVPRGVVSASLL